MKHSRVIYHRHDFGDWLNNVAQGKGLFKTPLSSEASSALGAVGGLAGGLAGGLIGGGMQSSTGDILGGIGKAASAIPGPWGMVAGAGLQVLGGVANRAFGSKMNQGNINKVEDTINQLNSFNADAGSFDDLAGIMESAPSAMTFDNSFIGKDGWFSNKAKNKANALRKEMALARAWRDNSIDNNIENLRDSQMNNLLINYAAFGGPLHSHGADWTNGVTIIDNGGTHEQNPLEGVPMGMAEDGIPNLVEEGEVIFNDYVFSNRIKVPQAVREKYKLRGTKEMTFADAAKKAQKESEERPNDPISKRGLEDIMNKLMVEQESIRQKRNTRKYAKGGRILAHKHATDPYLNSWKGTPYPLPDTYWDPNVDYLFPNAKGTEYGTDWGLVTTPKNTLSPIAPTGNEGTTSWKPIYPQLGTPSSASLNAKAFSKKTEGNRKSTDTNSNSWLSGLRFVPALGASIGVFGDLMGWTNKPDYSGARSILDAAYNIGDVSYTPIGDYMRYTPLDRLFYANQLGSQASATRRSLLNTSGGNRGAAMAGLLAADYNAQGQLGNLFRQAEEYNLGQREKVAAFNRGTNMFNTENALRAQMANKDIARVKIDAAARAAAMRDAIDARVGAARSANLTNLFDSLGDIGREAFAMDMIRNNKGLLYDWMGRYKGEQAAKGGKLTIKKRRK